MDDSDRSFVRFIHSIGSGSIDEAKVEDGSQRSVSSDQSESASVTISRQEFQGLIQRIESLEQSNRDNSKSSDVERGPLFRQPLEPSQSLESASGSEDDFVDDEAPSAPGTSETAVVAFDDAAVVTFDDTKEERQVCKRSTMSSSRLTSKWKFEQYELPPSTFTFLITKKVLSKPFFGGILAVSLSLTCLIVVLMNELENGNERNVLGLPAGVPTSVKVAQYLGIIIGVLMEEEVPLGLEIIGKCVEQKIMGRAPFDNKKVIFSCVLRMAVGYLFLACLFLTVLQENNVLDIFFDVLALEFVESIDDVIFALSKRGFFGKNMRRASNQTYVYEAAGQRTEKYSEWMSIFVRAVYLFNALIMIFGLTFLMVQQDQGKYRCQSISVAFGDDVWEEALVTSDHGTEYEKRLLVYSHFNGIYREADNYVNGRPRYVEMNKKDGKAEFRGNQGSEIVYCKDLKAWVLRHDRIFTLNEGNENECSWLMKSPQTDSFDVIQVAEESSWSVWTGQIRPDYSVSITCNECGTDADCNYHGHCINLQCECEPEYSGIHCDIEQSCSVIRSERDSNTTLQLLRSKDNSEVKIYGHPVYYQPMSGIPHGLLRLGDHTGHGAFMHNVGTENHTTATESNPHQSHNNHGSGTHSQQNAIDTSSMMSTIAPVEGEPHHDMTAAAQKNSPAEEGEPDGSQMHSQHEMSSEMSNNVIEAGEQDESQRQHNNMTSILSDEVTSSEMAENSHPSHRDLSNDFYADDDFFEIHYKMESFQKLMRNYTFVLRYTGRRWYGQIHPPGLHAAGIIEEDYHAFWDNAFSGLGQDDNSTVIISAPTIDNSPVGIDFFEMRRRNKVFETGVFDYDYGPFGVLIPLAGFSGAGFLHCNRDDDG